MIISMNVSSITTVSTAINTSNTIRTTMITNAIPRCNFVMIVIDSL